MEEKVEGCIMAVNMALEVRVTITSPNTLAIAHLESNHSLYQQLNKGHHLMMKEMYRKLFT